MEPTLQSYQPFEELRLCSNFMRRIRVPLKVGETPVLLIGRGVVPLIWIAAPTRPKGKRWDYLVKESRATNSRIVVERGSNDVTVRFDSYVLLHAWAVDDKSAVVDRLDLRPVGLLFYGDEDALHVGPTRLARNTFEGMDTALFFDAPK